MGVAICQRCGFVEMPMIAVEDGLCDPCATELAGAKAERRRLLDEIRCYSLKIPLGAVPGSVQPVGRWIVEHIEGGDRG